MKPVEFTDSVRATAVSHAVRLARRFPMVARDDIVQEQYVWLLQHPRKVAKWGEEEDTGQRKLSKAMRNAGLAYCHREKARAVGYDLDDLYFYSIGVLRELMPVVFDREAWVRLARSDFSETPSGKSDPAEGNNMLACLMDVSAALHKVPLAHYAILSHAFASQLDDEDLAQMYHTTPDGARMRVARALRKVQEQLGGERPDWAAASDRKDEVEHNDDGGLDGG